MARLIESGLLSPNEIEPFLEATSSCNLLARTVVYTAEPEQWYKAYEAYVTHPGFGQNPYLTNDPFSLLLRPDIEEILPARDDKTYRDRRLRRELEAMEGLSIGEVVGLIDVSGISLHGLANRYNKIMQKAGLDYKYEL